MQIISWLGKNRDDDWHYLDEQKWHSPKNIYFNQGDEISIETLSATGSLAILDYVEFSVSNQTLSPIRQSLQTVYPAEYPHAIRNPLKVLGHRLKKNMSTAPW